MDVLWDESHPGIYIRQDDADKDFSDLARCALCKLGVFSTGRMLLRTISAKCLQHAGNELYKVVICNTTQPFETCAAPIDFTRIVAKKDAKGPKRGFVRFRPGEGSGAYVYWCPRKEDYIRAADLSGKVWIKDELQLAHTESFIFLAHELIHACHELHGDFVKAYKGEGIKHEEARTVGLGPYKTDPLTENAIRRQHRFPPRLTYDCEMFKQLSNAFEKK